LKYRCLVLDHDDTVVQSTPAIHYPSFIEALKFLRPDTKPLSLEEFVSYCFSPGFAELCKDILKLNPEEQEYQYHIWKKYTALKTPDFYPGFPELINEYKRAGGIICVVSHSESAQIIRDYKLHCDFLPDLVFGWELPENQRKPSAYPLLEIMRRFQLNKSEILVVDDLRPGLVMAKSCDIDFASAGWSHLIPEIKEYMMENSDYYFATIQTFRKFVL
jgi:phosphoglycolate phosphatase-like HAD superfamily hydrolase